MIWFELYSDTSKPSTRVTFGDNTIHRVLEMKIPGWNDELGALVDRNYAEMESIRSRSKKAGKKVRDAMARYGMNDESLPTALEAMFKDCYTREDLEAFKLACEAQCDEWRISEDASTGPVPEIETQPEPKSAEPTFEPTFEKNDACVEVIGLFFSNPARLEQFKQGINSKKNREHRLETTRQRQKKGRSYVIYQRRGALSIPEPMAVDDDEVSTTTTTESSSTVPVTQGDVVVESTKPLASLTPIASDLDDESTIVSASTAELNEWFPITLPAKPLASLTIISSDLDDDSTMVSHSTEELNELFPITLPTIVHDAVAVEEEKLDEPEFPFIGTIIEVPSEEESSGSTLPTVVQEDARVEAAALQDDVVFDIAGDEPFDIEVDDEVEQVTTVSDAEYDSIVFFLAAFTTARM